MALEAWLDYTFYVPSESLRRAERPPAGAPSPVRLIVSG